MKEAQASVLEPFLGKSEFANHGQRVVEGQRLMQAASDIMLGWIRTDRASTASSATSTSASSGTRRARRSSTLMEPNAMMESTRRLCGWTLAKAHARSGDAIAIASYLGTSDVFDRAMAAFAETYADQNERDYEALKAAADSGRVKVESGL